MGGRDHKVNGPTDREGEFQVTATIAWAQCLVCERLVKSYVSILHAAVCEECEQKLLQTEPADPGYEPLVESFRLFWQGVAEAAASLDSGE